MTLEDENERLRGKLEMAKGILILAHTIAVALKEELEAAKLKLTTQTVELNASRNQYDVLASRFTGLEKDYNYLIEKFAETQKGK